MTSCNPVGAGPFRVTFVVCARFRPTVTFCSIQLTPLALPTTVFALFAGALKLAGGVAVNVLLHWVALPVLAALNVALLTLSPAEKLQGR